MPSRTLSVRIGTSITGAPTRAPPGEHPTSSRRHPSNDATTGTFHMINKARDLPAVPLAATRDSGRRTIV
ncbi:hypothetical protein Acsp06_18710 [Actinomycetospora sp. NBRC 106375]|nr:hypothetical protein Acsp06_18710 [Actinomycetospora sp. NBRC 106375]